MALMASLPLSRSAFTVPDRKSFGVRSHPTRVRDSFPRNPFSPSFSSTRLVPLPFQGSKRVGLFDCRASKADAAGAGKPEAKPLTPVNKVEDEEEEEYEEVSWITDKIESTKELTASVIQRVPGPRVGSSSLPWLVALPAFYFSITFLIAVVRTILKWRTPKAKRRRLIGKNAVLVEQLDATFSSGRQNLGSAELRKLERQCGFSTDEVLRKYIRYALNEKPFNPSLVADLIHLRQTSELPDLLVVEIVNDIARRTVKAKGAVMMDTRGLTEKGVQRKAAVQAIFTKLLYLSELDDFCSPEARKSSEIKAIFGVTDEDADTIRIQSLSQVSDLDSLEEMMPTNDEE